MSVCIIPTADDKPLKFILENSNPNDLFDVYEMIIDDYYTRQSELISKQIADYFDKNFVNAKDFAEGDKNVFYVSSKEGDSNEINS